MIRRTFLTTVAVAWLARPASLLSAPRLEVSWRPSRLRVADVAVLGVPGPGDGATVEGSVQGRPLAFYRDARGYAALVGFDVDLAAGPQSWRIDVREPGRAPRHASGTVHVRGRAFPVQRLTLPAGMVDLDPDTERRALAEGDILRAVYRTITPERLWRGPFVRPVAVSEPGSGFGSRRIINGQPRAPHTGTDYAAARGAPVVAVNDGRVALVGEFFFPGRLVVVDHGLGLHTLYFHLDEIRTGRGDRVTRGQPLGAVGSTGRATGPHLHFGAHIGASRIDPERLFDLPAL